MLCVFFSCSVFLVGRDGTSGRFGSFFVFVPKLFCEFGVSKGLSESDVFGLLTAPLTAKFLSQKRLINLCSLF